MQQAPFTSDAVLEAFSKKESGFSVDMIRDILCQLPQTMRDQINEGRNIRSEKEQMELHAARHKRTRDRIISRAIQQLAADTIDRSTDMIKFLKNTGSISFDYRLAEIYDAQNKTELANQILQSIGIRATAEKAADDYQDYIDFRSLMHLWKATDKDLNALEADDILQLRQYALRPNITSAKAIALLELNGISEYIERVYFPKIEETAQIADDSQDNNDNVLLIYPNPAKEYITLRHSMMEAFEDATITVTDIMGKTVYQQNITEKQNELVIHIGQLPQGQYFCTLKSDHIMVNQKFLLIH